MRERRPEDVDRVAVGEVLRRGVQVVTLEERPERPVLETPRRVLSPGRALFSYPGGFFQPLGLGFVQLGLPVLWLLSRAVA